MDYRQQLQFCEDDAASMQAKVDAIVDEKNNARIRLANLKKEYSEMLFNDLPQAEVSKKKREMERLSREVEDYDERIEFVRQMRIERMQENLNTLNEAKEKFWKDISDEYDVMMLEARRLKAELLLHYRKISEKKELLRWSYERFMTQASISQLEKTDPEKYRKYKYSKGRPPQYWFSSTYTGSDVTVSPLEGEMSRAFEQGVVPIWVQLYEKTGEIVWRDNEAQQKLQELKDNE
ncbi:hypothetical protein GTO89_16565 [Heliobacterium gestii]|uniref:Uncharacterized protein n=1 Tax=Heliomicrobium gestii TaxID=2699 RepID=A0A845LP28_HELGE|nr:hypothetical protein [Heliomicrobium gestii]MBM7867321.1 type I site-specific restriction endonuclease [Heliomicrobium gestii]MZP44636.1 hypothetical protein [Heliomicrobium gestii]